jgi:hypothetical protein
MLELGPQLVRIGSVSGSDVVDYSKLTIVVLMVAKKTVEEDIRSGWPALKVVVPEFLAVGKDILG